MKSSARGDAIQKSIRQYYQVYLLILPALLFVIVFSYFPLYGIQLAFKSFDPALGITGSPWSGFGHFHRFMTSPSFWQLIQNTVLLNLYQIAICFPAPILFALMLNELRHPGYKKIVQMVTYAPYFISVVAIVGMIQLFLKYDGGLITNLILKLGGNRTDYLSDPGAFRTIYVLSDLWQFVGWNAIIYLATLSSVDPELVEAATMDGANRLQKIWHIDLPGIAGTISIMLVLRVGQLLSIGFDKVFLLQNSLNMETSDVISTYVYRVGLVGGQYSYTTAIGVFNSLVNFIILISINRLTRAISGNSLW